MHPCKDWNEVNRLIAADEASLPPRVRTKTTTEYFEALIVS